MAHWQDLRTLRSVSVWDQKLDEQQAKDGGPGVIGTEAMTEGLGHTWDLPEMVVGELERGLGRNLEDVIISGARGPEESAELAEWSCQRGRT